MCNSFGSVGLGGATTGVSSSDEYHSFNELPVVAAVAPQEGGGAYQPTGDHISRVNGATGASDFQRVISEDTEQEAKLLRRMVIYDIIATVRL